MKSQKIRALLPLCLCLAACQGLEKRPAANAPAAAPSGDLKGE